MASFSHLLRSAPFYSPAKYTSPGQTQRQERRLHATQRPLINPYATLTADDFDTFVDDVSNRIAGALSYDREAELASKRRGYAGDDEYWLELGGKPGEFLGGAAAAPEDEVQQHQTREDDDLAEAEGERLDGRAQSAQPFPAGDPASHRSVTLVSNGDEAEGEQDRQAAVDADASMLDNLSDADEDSAEAEPEEEYNNESEDEQLDEEDEDELEQEDSGAEQATLQTRQPPSSQVEPITLDDTTDEDEGEGEAEDDEEEEEEEGQEEYDDGNGSEEDEDEDDDQEADENGHEPAQSQPRWRPAQVSRNSNVSLETDDGHLILLRDEQEDDHGEQKEAEEQDDDDGKNEANSSQGEAGMPPAVFPDSNLAFETANGNVVTLPPPSSTTSSAPTAFSPTSNVYPDLAYLQDLPPQPVAQTLYPSLDGLASAGFGFIPASTLLRQAEAASPFASQHGTEPQQSLDANAGAAANPDPDVSYDMGALPELNGEGDDIMPIDLLLDAANEDVERVQEAVDKVVEADAEEDRLNAELLELVHQQQPEPSLRIDEESEMADPGAAEHGRALADDEGDESGEDERVEEEGDVNSLEQQDPQSPREQQRRSASKQESDVISIGSSSEEDETEAPPAPRRPPAAHQSQVSQQYARKTLPQTAVPAPVPSQARLMSRRVLDQLDEEDREASGYTSDGEGPVREGHLFGQEEGDADADAAALEENEDDPDAREFRRMQQGVRRRRAVEEEQDAEDAYFGEESEGDDERDSAEVEDEDEDGDAQGSEGEGSSSSAETAGAGATQQKRHRPTSTRDEFADEVDDQELDEQEERAKRFKTDADIEDRVPIPRFMKKDSSGEYVLDYSGDEAGEDEEEEEEEESEGDEEGEEDGEEEEGESNDEKEDEHGDGAAGEAIEDSTKHADGMVALQDGDGAWEKSEIDDAGPSVASASADIGSAQTADVELAPNRSTEQESVAAADAGATDEVQLAVSGTADQDPAGTGVLSPSGDVLEEILHTFEADPQEGAVVTSTSISATVSTTVQAKSSSMDDDKQEPLKTGVAPVVAETDAHSAEQPSEPAARGAHEPLNIDPASESANVQTDYSSAAAPDQASEAITAARRKSVTPAPELRDGDMASSTQPLSPSTPSTKAARSASHAPFLPQSLIIPPQEASSSVVSAISPLPAAWPQLGSASDVAEASSPALVSPTLPASLHLPAQDLTPGGPESNFATDPLAIADPKPMFAPQTHDAGAEQSDVGLDVTAASSDPALANASLDAGQAMEVDTSEPEGSNAALQGGEAKDIGDRPAHEPSAEPDEKEYTSQIPPYTTETDASFDAGSLFPSTAPLYTAETDASFDERSLFPGTTDPDASFDATSLLAPAVAAPVREDSLPPAPALSRRHSGQPGNGHSGTPTRVLNAIQPGLWKPGTPIRFGGRSLQAAVREAAYDPERSRTLEESLVGRKAEEVTTAESPEEALEAPDSDFIALSEGHTTDTADAALALQADPPIGDSASAEAEAPFHSEDGPAAMSPVRQASQEPESTLLPNMQEVSNDKGTGGSAPIPVGEYTDAVPDYLPAASASGSEQERLSSEALDQEAGDDEEEANALVAILLSPKGKTFTTSGTAPVANRASVRSKGKGRRSQTPEASVRASPRGRSQTRREGRSSSDSGPVERRRSSRSDSGAEPVEEHEPPRVTDQAAAGDEEEDDSDIKEVAASRSPAKIALSTVTATGADSTPIKRRSISQSQRVLLPSTPEHAEPAPGNATEEAVEDMEVVSLLTTRPSRPRFHKHGESHSEAAQRRQAAASATERTSARGGVPSHDITTGQSPAVVHPRMERDDHKHGLTSSPITTRSHCTYHKLSIPNPLLRDGHRASGADTPLRRMSTRLARAHESTGAVGNHPSHYVFLVPGCCVTRDLIDKESSAGSGRGMEDLGVANNDEEGKAIRILSMDEGGDGEKLTVTGIPDEVIQSLIRVVGLELFRDGDCEILGPIATRSTEGQDESKAVSPSAAPAGPLPSQSERKRRRESDMGGMTGTPHKRAK